MFDYVAYAALIKQKRGEQRISQENLAADALGDPARKSEVSRIENGKTKPNETTIQKLNTALDISEAEMSSIRQPRPVAGQLDTIPTLSAEQLENLAARFGYKDPYGADPGTLRAFLTEKATDYRALKSEVDAIDDGLKRLSNLKAAAADAIARVDLEEVEELLSRVQEVELEEAAKTAELRANNALLRGNVEQAYRLLSATADSFAAIDPIEPTRRKNGYMQLLYRHGLRFGDFGLEKSVELIQEAIENCEKHSVEWAMSQNALGNALVLRGTRTKGQTGNRLLDDGIKAFEKALLIRTKDALPMEWAITKNNIASALQAKGFRTSGQHAEDLLSKAASALRDSMTVDKAESNWISWARTQNNLGGVLYSQGVRSEGDTSIQFLTEAIDAYQSALTIRTKADWPQEWGTTMNNLGDALCDKGARVAGPTGRKLLDEGLEAYESALTVRKEGDQPVRWALTKYSMASAKEATAIGEPKQDQRSHLEVALAYAKEALTVFAPEHMSYQFEQATALRDRLKERLKELP